MWWNRIIFGIDGYEVVMWFLTYSMMGWLVESIYMSFCNHKITNRGFAKGAVLPDLRVWCSYGVFYITSV